MKRKMIFLDIDGTLVSAPLEDLAPFLPEEELREQMIIPMVDEKN